MAIVVYPLDAISGAPSYTGRMLRETVAPLVAGATSGRPLGIRSGVRPGTSITTVTLASLTYSIGEFAGAVDAESAGEAGPYLFANNATATGNLNAQDASNPRADMLVLQISDNAEDGLGAAGGAFVYAAGTAAASPVLPAQPARSILLATFAVPKVGAGSPTVTWVAPVLAAAGGIPAVNSAAQRDATFPSPVQGDRCQRLDQLIDQMYWGLYNASTNPYGAKTAGWYPADPNIYTQLAISSNVAVPAADTDITWASADYIFPGMWSAGAPTRLVLPILGVWEVGFGMTTTAGDTRLLRAGIYKNGTTFPTIRQNMSGTSGVNDPFPNASGLVPVTALTDYVTLAISTNSLAASVVATGTKLWARYVGPQRST